MAALRDRYGRLHDNLRLSVTDRCNIRCFYCMPEEGPEYMQRSEILSYEEMEAFVRVAADLGVNKVRITGGEPLVRRDLPELIHKLARIPGIRDLALTTNAVLLESAAQPLKDAGLQRLNIHVDTLDRARFQQITRRDDLHRVQAGIDAALRVGFPVKLNAVAVKGLNEPDLVPLARFALEHDLEVRFIEYMPLDHQGLWRTGDVLTMDRMLDILRADLGEILPAPDQDPHAPATEFRFASGRGRLGFIASVSKPFCGDCNRIRLTSDGKLRYCLFAVEETDLRPALRPAPDPERLRSLIESTVLAKWQGHQIGATQFIPPPRPMYAIGG